VIGDHQVVVAQLLRRQHHLPQRGAAVGGVGVAVAVAADGRPQRRGGLVERRVLRGLQPPQIDRLLPGHRLRDAAGGHLAHALEPHQLAGPDEAGDLVGVPPTQHRRRGAERPHAVGGLVCAFEQKGDPSQVGRGVPGFAHSGDRRTMATPRPPSLTDPGAPSARIQGDSRTETGRLAERKRATRGVRTGDSRSTGTATPRVARSRCASRPLRVRESPAPGARVARFARASHPLR
jgi:hypothetical protein